MRWLLLVGVLAFSASTAAGQDSPDGEARQAFERGRTEFDAGHFEEAARHLRQAYVLSPRYELLYNIGLAELRAGHNDRALEAFDGFLRQAPADEPRRSEIEERARVLRALEVVAPEPEVVAPAPTETAPLEAVHETPVHVEPADEPDIAPWVVAGVGGAVLIAGGALMGIAGAEASRVTNPAPGSTWASLEGAQSNALTLWPVGISLLAVGVATTTVGTVWGVLANEHQGSVSARLRILPTGAWLEGSF